MRVIFRNAVRCTITNSPSSLCWSSVNSSQSPVGSCCRISWVGTRDDTPRTDHDALHHSESAPQSPPVIARLPDHCPLSPQSRQSSFIHTTSNLKRSHLPPHNERNIRLDSQNTQGEVCHTVEYRDSLTMHNAVFCLHQGAFLNIPECFSFTFLHW